MAKKKGALGKLIAFTTAVAAIGGVCYIFRDKIMESSLFQSASGKANDLYDNMKNKISRDEEDDFFFDDDDDFFESTSPSESTGEREYTSLSINTPSETEVSDTSEDTSTETADAYTDSYNSESSSPSVEPDIPPAQDSNDYTSTSTDNDSIPTIDFGNSFGKTETVTSYENEGLSDVSEDPDTLEDMDKLDF